MQAIINHYFSQFRQDKTEKTFKKIYQHSNTQLFGIILRILKKRELSEDCLQEVYLKIWNHINTYTEDKANAMTWMSVIAKNQAIDFLRKRQIPIKDDFDLQTISNGQLDCSEVIYNNQIQQQLSVCLRQMKPEITNVLALFYFNDLPYSSIAKILNKPVNTLKTRANRALPVLKKCLENNNGNRCEVS